MSDDTWLAERFESDRARLRAVALRMLGSASDADDAVQEAWLRLSRSSTDEIENLSAWLTTVVGRICLDMLRSRSSRREDATDAQLLPEPADRAPDPAQDPELQAQLADSVGLALLVVLDSLDPAERLAFVLHDLFAVPFDEIAPILGRTPTAARQLASRARRRVRQGGDARPATIEADRRRRTAVVDAFLAASRDGDFEALVRLLDPDAVLRADGTVVAFGAEPVVRGAREVATTFAGRARAARPADIDGLPGLVWLQAGETKVVFAFTLSGDRVVAIDMLGDTDYLAGADIELAER